jgi:transcriptional regulator with XRE-family HTH domain
MDAVQIIGRRIRTLRHQRGWSQTELAKKGKVHLNTVCLLELGTLDTTTLRTLVRLAHALEISLGELCRDLDEQSCPKLSGSGKRQKSH